VVPVLRRLDLAAEELEVPGLDRGPEPIHLSPGVVEVVLALDRPPGRLEHPGQGVAEGGVAPLPDVERARRIRAHELHLSPAAVRLHAPEPLPALRHLAQDVRQTR
jgi:hypothetical protein